MKLLVGLGNPGSRYEATRHNVGFMVVDRLVRERLLDGPRGRFHAEAYQGVIGSESVLVLKPQTYMNRSGLSVGEAARYFKVEPSDVLVIVDDVALPVGTIRLRGGGGAGGHNGLASVQQALGTAEYARLRVGVDPPEVNGRRIDQADYVLSPFSAEQGEQVKGALEAASSAAACWVTDGVELAMTRFNTPSAKGRKQSAEGEDAGGNDGGGESTKPKTRSRSESSSGDSQTTERTENL